MRSANLLNERPVLTIKFGASNANIVSEGRYPVCFVVDISEPHIRCLTTDSCGILIVLYHCVSTHNTER